ncbi:MAG: hypothetical protein C7B44_00780 [Sulfobacillus thermosulfidooxidans]|uniref:Hydrogenase n=1 Tax=Sulfobacillus thermotolerans TaxID=338644 RepID=A0ABN5GZT3_9FIRM|nr:hypothetical protein [Sulfobacillus sp. hq2]AUW93859.1 hypothetical protein BXT84_07805 [Sulfobacillus thermotolerans]POB11327.1 hypothetical protein CO251_05290 [Sulfobacillus sp. hq2]PSR38026.1 MAG: hypothetical protein C7B44_00780 [Sulfobacillus thermosulfidooxidans]
MATAGLLVFLAAGGLLWSRNIARGIWFLVFEGGALGVMVWTSGPLTLAVAVIGAVTMIVKAGLIPYVMHRVMHRWPQEFRQDSSLPLWAYGMAALLVLAVTHAMHLLASTGIMLHQALFFYGLATIHWGLLMVVSRRHVLSQVAALVSVENGLVILAASVAGALPTFMELGMLGDLLVAAGLLVWMSWRIHHHLQSTDVATLKQLRG